MTFARFFVDKDFRFGHFHFLNGITYQKALSHAYDVRVPGLVVPHLIVYYRAPAVQKGSPFASRLRFFVQYSLQWLWLYAGDKQVLRSGQGYYWQLPGFGMHLGKWQSEAFHVLFQNWNILANDGFSGNWYFIIPLIYPLIPLSQHEFWGKMGCFR